MTIVVDWDVKQQTKPNLGADRSGFALFVKDFLSGTGSSAQNFRTSILYCDENTFCIQSNPFLTSLFITEYSLNDTDSDFWEQIYIFY